MLALFFFFEPSAAAFLGAGSFAGAVFCGSEVEVLRQSLATDAAFGMRYAFLSFNTVLGISVFLRFSMPRYWSLSVVVLYLIQLGWAFERFFANPGM